MQMYLLVSVVDPNPKESVSFRPDQNLKKSSDSDAQTMLLNKKIVKNRRSNT
jgi:hypothetical protein